MFRSHKLFPTVWMFVLCAGLLGTPGSRAEECSPNIDARLDTKESEGEVVKLQFAVEVSSRDNCAKITYDLVLELQLPNGQTQKVRKVRVVKLSDGSLSEMVRHELPANTRLVNYKTELVSCEVCSLG